MTLQFTPAGIQINTLQEEFDSLAEQYRAIYGADIDLDQESPDGQRVGIEAKARYDVQVFGLNVYNSMDPDFAEGDALQRLLKFNGTSVRAATRSTWDLEVTVAYNLTLEAGYQIKDDLNQLWKLPSDVVVTSGANIVTFQSVDFGPIVGLTGSVLTQATVVLGVTGLAALTDAVVGQAEETEPQTRRRRNRSLRNPAYTTTGSLFARLAETPGVTDLEVYDNDTNVYNSALDLNAHTVWCVVEGGTIADIAETFAKNKNAGTGWKGSIAVTYTETRTRPNGTTYLKTHYLAIDRPTYVPLYVRMTATVDTVGDTVNTDLIKERLEALEVFIGLKIAASDLYEPAQGDAPNFYLTDLEVSTDGITWTDGEVSPGPGGKFTIDGANITVTV